MLMGKAVQEISCTEWAIKWKKYFLSGPIVKIVPRRFDLP